MKNLEHSNFNKYPHIVFATAFLVDGKLCDYKIGNKEESWGTRTFRGSNWENKVFERLRNNDAMLTCEYNALAVNDDKEHNKAFEDLEDWLFDKFQIYPEANLHRLGY